MAHRMQKVGEAALQDELIWEPSIAVQKLTHDNQENLDKWKVHFLGGLEGFEEEELQAGAFRIDEWEY